MYICGCMYVPGLILRIHTHYCSISPSNRQHQMFYTWFFLEGPKVEYVNVCCLMNGQEGSAVGILHILGGCVHL